ncbi:hypothetical protein [Deinococcus kurensis]|uniref:hypothetical protein n=1 Tax=Deinococcus kurensis TaxID=2662757 RepID=UPI0012D36861|nr:hypothetical protein [Deinococcus kurensis]
MTLALRPRITRMSPVHIDPDRLARHNAQFNLRVLNADAVIARARRAAQRALPERASLPCGCGLDTICPTAARAYLAGDAETFSAHRAPLFTTRLYLRVTPTGTRLALEALS